MNNWVIDGWQGSEKPANVMFFEVTGSTNLVAKELAREGGIDDGTLVVADAQTEGRGRNGRSFYSPGGSGIYMTVAFAREGCGDPSCFTTAAAVCVCRALEHCIPGRELGIKWVNDIYLGKHKVCGILAEAVTNVNTMTVDTILVGIGINLDTKDFPEAIARKAGSLCEEVDENERQSLKARIVSQIYGELAAWVSAQRKVSFADRTYMDEYRRRCFLIGKEVLFFNGYDPGAGEINVEASLTDARIGTVEDILDTGEIVLTGTNESGRPVRLVFDCGECRVLADEGAVETKKKGLFDGEPDLSGSFRIC